MPVEGKKLLIELVIVLFSFSFFGQLSHPFDNATYLLFTIIEIKAFIH